MKTRKTRRTRQAWPRKAGVCGLVRAVSSHDPPLGFALRRVAFRIDWEPEAALAANESHVLAAVNQVVAEDLARFKGFIEAR